MGSAPAMAAAPIADRPAPPAPNTATDWPSPTFAVRGRPGAMGPLTVPEHTGLVGGDRRGAGPLAPWLDPGLNQRLVHPGGHAQLGNVPVPGSVKLVLAVAQ